MPDLRYDLERADLNSLNELWALERSCFSDPWSPQSLRLHLEAGHEAVLLWQRQPDGEQHLLAYALGQSILDEAELLRLGVVEQLRCQGLATRVLRALLKSWEKQGVSLVFLEVREKNQAARRVYENLGFTAYACRRAYYRLPDDDAILYRLNLHDRPGEESSPC